MRVTAPALSCVRASRHWTCRTLPVLGRRLPYGHPVKSHCRQRSGRVRGDRRNWYAATVKELALDLPASAWRKMTWREGAASPLSSRFARVRVRVAHSDYRLSESRPEEWLLIEWPKGE